MCSETWSETGARRSLRSWKETTDNDVIILYSYNCCMYYDNITVSNTDGLCVMLHAVDWVSGALCLLKNNLISYSFLTDWINIIHLWVPTHVGLTLWASAFASLQSGSKDRQTRYSLRASSVLPSDTRACALRTWPCTQDEDVSLI